MEIDIRASLLQTKLIYKQSYFRWFIYYFLVLIVPLHLLVILFTKDSLNVKEIVFYCIIGFPFFWNALGLRYIDTLLYLEEVEISTRMEYIQAIKTKYEYDTVILEKDIAVLKKGYDWFSAGKELTLVFDQEKVYGNLTHLGKNELRIPFYSYCNLQKLYKWKTTGN